jgi:HK97 family phage portal protein
VNNIGLLNNARNWWNRRSLSLTDKQILELFGIETSGITANKLKEITYFTCIKILGETISKLPLKLYKSIDGSTEKAPEHPLYHLLKTRPNPLMTAASFWKYVEYQRNDKGNAVVYIETTNKGKVSALWPLNYDDIEVWVDNAGLFGTPNDVWYIYKKAGKEYRMHHEEVLHFISGVTTNGITGLSMPEYLKTQVENAQYGQNYINNYWKSGLQGAGILYYTGDLNERAKNNVKNKIQEMAQGIKNAGQLIPIPLEFKYEKFNNSMADSQFLEVSKLTVTQIAAAFGVKMHQLNDLERATNHNHEQQQKAFYADTLLAILTAYEQELNHKLLLKRELLEGYEIRFNVDALLRVDIKTRYEAYRIGIQSGFLKINEARRMENLPTTAEGESLICNGNMQFVKDIGAYYKNEKGGKKDASDTG